MTDKYFVRGITKGDGPEIADMISSAFNIKRSTQFLDWKFHQNPAGETMGQIAIHDKKIIGMGNAIPVLMKIGDTEVPAGLSGDFFIHSDHRKGGPFRNLVRSIVNCNLESGMRFMFGFANETSARVNRLIGFKEIARIFQLTLPLDVAPYVNTKVPFFPLSKPLSFFINTALRVFYYRPHASSRTLSVKRIQSFDERFDRLWETVSDTIGITSVRRMSYLNWRYVDCPVDYHLFAIKESQDQKIHGFIVLNITQDSDKKIGQIIDCLYDSKNPDILDMLIDTAINFFRQNGCHIVRIWALEHMDLFQYLRGRKFVIKETQFSLIVRPSSADEKELLLNPGHWYLTKGDSDAMDDA